MTKKFIIITAVLSAIGIVFQILLSGGVSAFGWVLQSIILAFLIALISLFFRPVQTFSRSLQRNTLIILSLSGICSILLILVVTLSNLFPASLSRITLSNGKSTIVFMEMSHIATSRYYATVASDLRGFAGSGYTLYLEWVEAGSPENTEKFQKLLGIKLEPESYARMAQIFWLTAQDPSLFHGIQSGSLVRADISIDDIMALVSTGKSLSINPPVDIASELEDLPVKKNNLFQYIIRWVLNLSLRTATDSDILIETLDPDLMSAILDARNRHLVSTFRERWDTKAVFVYGALHFDGVYALLKSQDPNWNIIDFSPLYPYVP